MALLVVFVFVLPLLALAMSLYVLLKFKRFASKLSAITMFPSGKDSVNGFVAADPDRC